MLLIPGDMMKAIHKPVHLNIKKDDNKQKNVSIVSNKIIRSLYAYYNSHNKITIKSIYLI